MAEPSRQMALGAFLPGGGVHGAGWRLPEVDVASSSSFDAFRRVAQRLEQGRFDTLFMNDSVGVSDLEPRGLERNTQAMRWDPLTLLPALAVVTERIGLTATANTTYNEPYTLARRLARSTRSATAVPAGTASPRWAAARTSTATTTCCTPTATPAPRSSSTSSPGCGTAGRTTRRSRTRRRASGSTSPRLHLLNHKGRISPCAGR